MSTSASALGSGLNNPPSGAQPEVKKGVAKWKIGFAILAAVAIIVLAAVFGSQGSQPESVVATTVTGGSQLWEKQPISAGMNTYMEVLPPGSMKTAKKAKMTKKGLVGEDKKVISSKENMKEFKTAKEFMEAVSEHDVAIVWGNTCSVNMNDVYVNEKATQNFTGALHNRTIQLFPMTPNNQLICGQNTYNVVFHQPQNLRNLNILSYRRKMEELAENEVLVTYMSKNQWAAALQSKKFLQVMGYNDECQLLNTYNTRCAVEQKCNGTYVLQEFGHATLGIMLPQYKQLTGNREITVMPLDPNLICRSLSGQENTTLKVVSRVKNPGEVKTNYFNESEWRNFMKIRNIVVVSGENDLACQGAFIADTDIDITYTLLKPAQYKTQTATFDPFGATKMCDVEKHVDYRFMPLRDWQAMLKPDYVITNFDDDKCNGKYTRVEAANMPWYTNGKCWTMITPFSTHLQIYDVESGKPIGRKHKIAFFKGHPNRPLDDAEAGVLTIVPSSTNFITLSDFRYAACDGVYRKVAGKNTYHKTTGVERFIYNFDPYSAKVACTAPAGGGFGVRTLVSPDFNGNRPQHVYASVEFSATDPSDSE